MTRSESGRAPGTGQGEVDRLLDEHLGPWCRGRRGLPGWALVGDHDHAVVARQVVEVERHSAGVAHGLGPGGEDQRATTSARRACRLRAWRRRSNPRRGRGRGLRRRSRGHQTGPEHRLDGRALPDGWRRRRRWREGTASAVVRGRRPCRSTSASVWRALMKNDPLNRDAGLGEALLDPALGHQGSGGETDDRALGAHLRR